MTFKEYQELAMRTQAIKDNKHDMLIHAVCGLSSEIGEIIQVYNELYDFYSRMNNINNRLHDRMIHELGDLCWFQAELCKALDISINYKNIDNIDQIIMPNEEEEPFTVKRKSIPYQYLFTQMRYYIDRLNMSVGLISGAVQKTYQGREIDTDKITQILYFMNILISSIVGCLGTQIEHIWEVNIEKLKARFPEGFSEDLDAHRQEGDL